MEKQNKNKKHGCFPRPDWRNEIIDALGIGIALPPLVLWKLAAALLPDAVRETAHSKIGGAYD